MRVRSVLRYPNERSPRFKANARGAMRQAFVAAFEERLATLTDAERTATKERKARFDTIEPNRMTNVG